MRNLIRTLCLLLALVLTNSAIAQYTVGLKGGINLATFSDNEFDNTALELDKEYLIGVDLAVFSTIKVAGVFSVQPELHWIQKGTKYTMTTSDDMDVKMVYRYNYLELPVLARVDFGENAVKFNVFAGPSVGYGLDGKFIGTNASYGDEVPLVGDFEEKLEWDTEYGDDGVKHNRWDVSAVAGFGLEYEMEVVNFLVDARYNYDFTDFINWENTPDPEPDKYYNRGFTFTVGVAFPLGL